MPQPAHFRALADPTRLALLEALRGGEHPVNDLVARVKIHQTGVSRHLRVLEHAGWVQVRPAGAQRLYSLRPEAFRDLEAWVARYQRIWALGLHRADHVPEREPRRPRSGGPKTR